MQDRGLDFKHKEVVNIKDGKRLGYVQDVCADLETGVITSIIVPGSNKFMNIFSSSNDIVIPWQNVKCIGDDLILVEIWEKFILLKKWKNLKNVLTKLLKKLIIAIVDETTIKNWIWVGGRVAKGGRLWSLVKTKT